MRGEFYKMEFDAWDEGTVDLSLEQEAAYLRLCHQMYRRRGAVPNSDRLLASLWRCHQNKARTLLKQLVDAGKIQVTPDGHLTNTRVTREVDARETLSTQRSHAGQTGGTRSGDARRKPLKSHEPDQASASGALKQNEADKRREEEIRGEEIIPPYPQGGLERDDAPSSPSIPEGPREDADQPASPFGADEAGDTLSRAKSSKPTKADREAAAEATFDAWWAVWPNQVDKKKAQKVYVRAIADGKITHEQLVSATQRYVQNKNPRVSWKGPAAWLNDERWDDNPAPEPEHCANGLHPGATIDEAGNVLDDAPPRSPHRGSGNGYGGHHHGRGGGYAGRSHLDIAMELLANDEIEH